MTTLRHILALNIKKRRAFLGFSQVKLAEMVNTAPTYIAMIELEKRSPSFEMIERIAKALQVDSCDLFSKTVYPVEIVKQFHKNLLDSFKKTLENHIIDFEKQLK